MISKKNILISFLFLLIFPVVCSGSITTKENFKILFITENYGANADNSVTWKTSMNFLASKVTPAYSLGSAGITQTTFANATQAVSTFEYKFFADTVSTILSNYIQNVASYLKLNKITYAKVDWFYSFYDQSDNNALKKVYLPLVIYPDGKMRNLGMRVINVNPKILYYIYKTKATEDIPQSWGYSDGGKLYKYVLDQNYNIISQSVVDTGGKYDPPIVSNGDSTIDPDSGLKLLINEVVKPEIQNYSALFAIVDYARQTQPVYDCDDAGNCTARISVESFSRQIQGGLCIVPVPNTYATGSTVYDCGGTWGNFIEGRGNTIRIYSAFGTTYCCNYSCNDWGDCWFVCSPWNGDSYCAEFAFVPNVISVPISNASFWGRLTTAQYRSGWPWFYVYDHATGSCICDRFTGNCLCSSGVYMRAWLGGFEWCHPICLARPSAYRSDAIWFDTWCRNQLDNYIQFYRKLDNSYKNTGRIGYTIQYTFERYFVDESGNYTLTAQSVGYTTAGQNFDKKVILNRQYSSSELANYIIDPFNTNQIYDFTNDTINNLPCNRYIYNGQPCSQAPISTISCQ